MSQAIRDIIIQSRRLKESQAVLEKPSKTTRYYQYPDSLYEIINNLNSTDEILSVSYKSLKQQKLSYDNIRNLNRARQLILDVIASLEGIEGSSPSRWW